MIMFEYLKQKKKRKILIALSFRLPLYLKIAKINFVDYE